MSSSASPVLSPSVAENAPVGDTPSAPTASQGSTGAAQAHAETEATRERVRRTRLSVATDGPLVSIVIPVYNEEKILRAAVHNLMAEVTDRFDWDFEVILTENGSKDDTVAIAHELARKYPNIRVLNSPEPNYGAALKKAILQARGAYVLCDEIDLCDTDFHARAMALLESKKADLVIGSKALGESQDDRPFFRRFATWVLNMLLRVFAGFKGTDTHGLKAFAKDKMLNVVEACKLDRDIFASEMVIRAERAYIHIVEIPIKLKEIRPPSVALMKRVPKALRQIFQLAWQIRFKG